MVILGQVMKLSVWILAGFVDLQDTPCPIKVNTKVIYAIDQCAVENNGWELQLDVTKSLIGLYGVFESALYSYGDFNENEKTPFFSTYPIFTTNLRI